jgi:very-short-patch-repair endonuclease
MVVRMGHTPEGRARLAESARKRFSGVAKTPEQRAKISATQKGKVIRPESRAKQSTSMKRVYAEGRGQRGQRKGFRHSQETKDLLSLRNRQFKERIGEDAYHKHCIDRSIKAFKWRKPSGIELQYAKWLDDQGIVWQGQVVIEGYIVDFYLPELNLIVEVNGCYWHACPECGQEGRVEQRAKDAKKEHDLTNAGYQLQWVWEHCLKQDVYMLCNPR